MKKTSFQHQDQQKLSSLQNNFAGPIQIQSLSASNSNINPLHGQLGLTSQQYKQEERNADKEVGSQNTGYQKNKNEKQFNVCCFEVKEAIITLLLAVRYKTQDLLSKASGNIGIQQESIKQIGQILNIDTNKPSRNTVNPEKIENEKEILRQNDILDIIENLRKHIEILIFMQDSNAYSNITSQTSSAMCSQQSNKNIQNSNNTGNLQFTKDELAKQAVSCFSGIQFNQNSNLTGDNHNSQTDRIIALINENFSSQKSTGTSKIDPSNNFEENQSILSSNNQNHNLSFKLPREYEEMIEKYEKDIRDHISVEHQMRIYIENFQNQLEDNQSVWLNKEKQYEETLIEIKREKRRLDDLLTIRENELEKLKQNQNCQSAEESQQVLADFEKKIKQMEKKHDKVVVKIQADVQKYKKRSEQMYATIQQQQQQLMKYSGGFSSKYNQDLNTFLTQSNEHMQTDDLLRTSQGSGKLTNRLSNDESQKINPLNIGTNQSIDSAANRNNNSSLMNNTFGIQSQGPNLTIKQSLPNTVSQSHQIQSASNFNNLVYDSVENFHKTQLVSSASLSQNQFQAQIAQVQFSTQQQQMYQIQQQQLFATLSSQEINQLKQEYKRQRSSHQDLSAERALQKAIQNQATNQQQQTNNVAQKQTPLMQQQAYQNQNILNDRIDNEKQLQNQLNQQTNQIYSQSNHSMAGNVLQSQSNQQKYTQNAQKVNQNQNSRNYGQQSDMIMLSSKINEYQNQMMMSKQQLLQQNQSLNNQINSSGQQFKRQNSLSSINGRNNLQQTQQSSHHRTSTTGSISQRNHNNPTSNQSQQFISQQQIKSINNESVNKQYNQQIQQNQSSQANSKNHSKERKGGSQNSNHKRSKSSLNFYPPQNNSQVEIVKILPQPQQQIEKENNHQIFSQIQNQNLLENKNMHSKQKNNQVMQQEQQSQNIMRQSQDNNQILHRENSNSRLRRTNSTGGFNQAQNFKQNSQQLINSSSSKILDPFSQIQALKVKQLDDNPSSNNIDQLLQSKIVDMRGNQVNKSIPSTYVLNDKSQNQNQVMKSARVANVQSTIVEESSHQQILNMRQRSKDQRLNQTLSQSSLNSKSVDGHHNKKKQSSSNVQIYQQNSSLNKSSANNQSHITQQQASMGMMNQSQALNVNQILSHQHSYSMQNIQPQQLPASHNSYQQINKTQLNYSQNFKNQQQSYVQSEGTNNQQVYKQTGAAQIQQHYNNNNNNNIINSNNTINTNNSMQTLQKAPSKENLHSYRNQNTLNNQSSKQML